MVRSKGYGKGSALFTVLRIADLQRVDLGIAMCHFELVAREAGLDGGWVVADPGLPLPGPGSSTPRRGARPAEGSHRLNAGRERSDATMLQHQQPGVLQRCPRQESIPARTALSTDARAPRRRPCTGTTSSTRYSASATLGSRLRPPFSRVPLVDREMLVSSFLRERRALTLVTAPAGYGKSIALAQWLVADPRPGAWLQLDESDNDPVVLLTYLALALGRVTPLDPGVLDLLQLRTPPMEERILPAMAAAVEDANPFLLVLDDGHLLHSDACWRLIDVLLAHLPSGAQLALGTRSTRHCRSDGCAPPTSWQIWSLRPRAGSPRDAGVAAPHDLALDPASLDRMLTPRRAGPPACASPCSPAKAGRPTNGCATFAATITP